MELKQEHILHLRKICGEDKIHWRTYQLGCPPEFCNDCRKENSLSSTIDYSKKRA